MTVRHSQHIFAWTVICNNVGLSKIFSTSPSRKLQFNKKHQSIAKLWFDMSHAWSLLCTVEAARSNYNWFLQYLGANKLVLCCAFCRQLVIMCTISIYHSVRPISMAKRMVLLEFWAWVIYNYITCLFK